MGDNATSYGGPSAPVEEQESSSTYCGHTRLAPTTPEIALAACFSRVLMDIDCGSCTSSSSPQQYRDGSCCHQARFRDDERALHEITTLYRGVRYTAVGAIRAALRLRLDVSGAILGDTASLSLTILQDHSVLPCRRGKPSEHGRRDGPK
jgi:hypothetical protein